MQAVIDLGRLFEDEHSVDARFLGGIGNVVCPILVIVDHRFDWTGWRGEFKDTTHSHKPASVTHYFRM